jgi:excinuclease UvrABC nuclease subunit
MRRYSRDQKYEEAGVVKQQLDALNRLATRTFDPGIYLSRAGVEGDMYAERLAHLSRVLRQYGIGTSFFRRIECIDISTLQGAWSTGSLVVFTDGIPDTSRYRRFRIRRDGKPNDVAMIAQIVTRRFAHPEWSLPDVFIVDGGKPQIHAAKQAMQATPATQKIPVIGLAKRFEELIVPVSVTPGLTRDRASYSFKTIRLPPSSPAIQLVRHIRDEAHRFAKTYHTVLRGKFFAN